MRKLLVVASIFAAAASTFAQRDTRTPDNPGLPRDGGFKISPLIVETRIGSKPGSKVSGTFTVSNESASTPAAILTQVTQLAVDPTTGTPVPGPKANCLKLSETSARLSPKTSHTFSWRATDCIGAFEIVATAVDARKVTNGISLRLGLGTAIYIEQQQSLTKDDVSFTWPDPQTLVVTNSSGKLARFSEVKAWMGSVFEQNGAEPLFPHSKLQIHFADHAPDRVELKADKLTLEAKP